MPGPSLTDERSTTERLREAGEILGRLHRTQIPSELAGQKLPNSERLLRAVERRLSSLNELGLLSSYEVSRLKHSAGQQLPYTLEDGLIHHDFCAENLIITVGNQLYAIDNEDMRIGVLDADLARTFHRWPMTSQQRQAFCEGYQRHREVVSYEGHSLFWLIWVLSGAIEFRAMRHLPCADLVVRMKQMFIGN